MGDEGANTLPDGENEPGWAKGLRERLERKQGELSQKEQELAQREAELERVRRDLLFDKVGIPGEKIGKLFRDSYQGELTEEAIRAAAIENGVLEQQRTTPEPEREAHERAMDALAGANPGDRLVSDDMDRQLADAIAEAQSGDEIDAILKRHKLYVYDA